MSTVTQLYTSQSLSARVAAEVRSHAAKRGLKQKDLAALLKLSPGQISGRFTGRIPFKLEELDVLAGHFGVDAAELMPRRPAVKNQPNDGSVLPQLDLNQQPFGWMSAQVNEACYGGSVVPLFAPGDPRWTVDPKRATRPEHDHPFRPILVSGRHLIAI